VTDAAAEARPEHERRREMDGRWDDDPAGEDEEQWREHVVNDVVAGEHVPTDEELDLDALEHEGLEHEGLEVIGDEDEDEDSYADRLGDDEE
jgi:hypothetical protein